MDRRTCLQSAAGALMASCVPAVFAQTAKPKPATGTTSPPATSLPLLRIYIPGGAGGGWDQTGRALGTAVQAAGLAQRVEYENKGGKGGTVGLADFVERYSSDPAALMIGGMVMVGAIALGRPKVTLDHVSPLARLTSDYMVLVVPADSRLANMRMLADEMKRNLAGVVFTGGSVGGVDHMLAGMVARQLRADPGALKYEPTSSGKEALALLASGKAHVAISSYSEFKSEIERKSLLPLATSSRHALFGIPSLSDQGIATELANWRAVFAPARIGDAQKEVLHRLVAAAVDTPAWRQSLAANSWIGAPLFGKDFVDALGIEQAMASAVTLMLKLKQG
jgi:putative tricarboxylic transport membrane protein